MRVLAMDKSDKTDGFNAKWFMVAGSGPTDYDAGVNQIPRLFAVDLRAGPEKDDGTKGNEKVSVFFPQMTGAEKAFMGDVLSVEGPERTVAYPGRRDGDRIGFGEDPIFSIAGAASDGVEIADLTGDGRSDVIMRFSRGDEKNRFVLILSPRGGKAR